MSYDLKERSEDEGQPIGLYIFQVGEDPKNWLRYTDHVEGVSRAGFYYTPEPFERAEVTVSGSSDRANIEIRCAADTAIVKLYTVFPPSYVVGLQVFEGHLGDTTEEFYPIIVGTIVNCLLEDSGAKLTCDLLQNALSRPGLRRNWQYSCPHPLYGPDCRAVRTLYPVKALSSPTANSVIVETSLAPAVFLNGTVDWTLGDREETRNIWAFETLTSSTARLTLSGVVNDLTIGQEMRLARGCKHTMADCRDVFNNILNYGGQPWIPLENPIESFSTFL